tara:strand:+ start:341 stop:571 length:231 start_codon:yes stop_codon:yes gene_type:complete
MGFMNNQKNYFDSFKVTFTNFWSGILSEPVIASIPHPRIEKRFRIAIVLNLSPTKTVLVSYPSFSNVRISSAFNFS